MRMKRIYSSAKCAIVAASAATADVGLLGAPGHGGGSVARCTSEDALDALLEATRWIVVLIDWNIGGRYLLR